MPLKRMVIATDAEGSLRAIGPVYNDDSVEKICNEIEDAGWTPLPQAALFTSVTDFRAEVKREP